MRWRKKKKKKKNRRVRKKKKLKKRVSLHSGRSPVRSRTTTEGSLSLQRSQVKFKTTTGSLNLQRSQVKFRMRRKQNCHQHSLPKTSLKTTKIAPTATTLIHNLPPPSLNNNSNTGPLPTHNLRSNLKSPSRMSQQRATRWRTCSSTSNRLRCLPLTRAQTTASPRPSTSDARTGTTDT